MTQIARAGKRLTRPRPSAAIHVSPRFRYLYVQNKKVGCSTIKLALQRAELDRPDYMPATSVHDRDASPLLQPAAMAPEAFAEALSRYYVFSFVRHPLGRLVSAYLNKIVLPQKGGRFRERAGFATDETPSFEAFVAALQSIDPARHDPHWRPQHLNLMADDLDYSFIGRLENFAADWRTVTQATGLPEKAEFHGKKSARDQPYASYFNADTRARAAEIYARDFTLYGYDPDDDRF